MAWSFTLSTAAGDRLQTLDMRHHWSESVASCSGIINTDQPLVTVCAASWWLVKYFFLFGLVHMPQCPKSPP